MEIRPVTSAATRIRHSGRPPVENRRESAYLGHFRKRKILHAKTTSRGAIDGTYRDPVRVRSGSRSAIPPALRCNRSAARIGIGDGGPTASVETVASTQGPLRKSDQ